MDVIKEEMGNRQKAGMNPSTLLTEHRRKVLFDAMLGTQFVKEPRGASAQKLSVYIAAKHPELLTPFNTLVLNHHPDVFNPNTLITPSLKSDSDSLASSLDDSSMGLYSLNKYSASAVDNTSNKSNTMKSSSNNNNNKGNNNIRLTQSNLEILNQKAAEGTSATPSPHIIQTSNTPVIQQTIHPHPLKISTDTLRSVSPNANANTTTKVSKSNKPKLNKILLQDPNKGKFKAKWENYDVMKYRWNYLRPQTQELCSEDQMLIPPTRDQSVVISSTSQILGFNSASTVSAPASPDKSKAAVKLRGKVLDYRNYANVTNKYHEKQEKIRSHTREIIDHQERLVTTERNKPYHIDYSNRPVSTSGHSRPGGMKHASNGLSESMMQHTSSESTMHYKNHHPSERDHRVETDHPYYATNSASFDARIKSPKLKPLSRSTPDKYDLICSKFDSKRTNNSGIISVPTYFRDSDFPHQTSISTVNSAQNE